MIYNLFIDNNEINTTFDISDSYVEKKEVFKRNEVLNNLIYATGEFYKISCLLEEDYSNLKEKKEFYFSGNKSKDKLKLKTRIKKSPFLKNLEDKFVLLGLSDDTKELRLKEFIENKTNIIYQNSVDIYKTYVFNYLFLSILFEKLIKREKIFKENNLIKADLTIAKFYYLNSYYYNTYNKNNLVWKSKIKNWIIIFEKELKSISLLLYALIDDLFENENFFLSFNNYKEELINLVNDLSKNIKQLKKQKDPIIENLNERFDRLSIKSFNFNNIFIMYNNLVNYKVNQLINNYNISVNFSHIQVNFGEIQSNIVFENLKDFEE